MKTYTITPPLTDCKSISYEVTLSLNLNTAPPAPALNLPSGAAYSSDPADALLKFNCDIEVCRLIVRMLRTCHNGEELKLALYELDRKKMIYADEMGAVFIRTILPLLGYEATFDAVKTIIKRL